MSILPDNFERKSVVHICHPYFGRSAAKASFSLSQSGISSAISSANVSTHSLVNLPVAEQAAIRERPELRNRLTLP
ncbi:MAG: hypothetical protein QGF47_12835, partial [Arenicellales bacterium]|nr:hypothetical protein [Arenicellales bacterium]